MWRQEAQRAIQQRIQKLFVQLCNEYVPFSGQLDIDGIVCISGGADMSRQLVLKIHETVDKHSITCNMDGLSGGIVSSLADCVQSPFIYTDSLRDGPGNSGHYLDTPSPNLPRAPQLQSPDVPHSDNNTLSMSLQLEEADTIHSSTTPIWSSSRKMSASPSLSSSHHDSLSPSPLPLSPPSDATYNQCSELLDPISAAESADRPKVVLTCNKAPYTPANLSCKFCPARFVSFLAFQSHLEMEHKRYPCKQCLSTFSMRCNLRRHERLHSGVKPYRCQHCSKCFARSTDLKIHLAKHNVSRVQHRDSLMEPQNGTRQVIVAEDEGKKTSSSDRSGISSADMQRHDQIEGSELPPVDVHKKTESRQAEDSLVQSSTNTPRQLEDRLPHPSADTQREVEDKVSSVLQQLLFNSDQRRVQVRNVIRMDTDEEDNNHTSTDDTFTDRQEVASSYQSIIPSCNTRNRRKKGHPVRVICLQPDEYREDEESLEFIDTDNCLGDDNQMTDLEESAIQETLTEETSQSSPNQQPSANSQQPLDQILQPLGQNKQLLGQVKQPPGPIQQPLDQALTKQSVSQTKQPLGEIQPLLDSPKQPSLPSDHPRDESGQCQMLPPTDQCQEEMMEALDLSKTPHPVNNSLSMLKKLIPKGEVKCEGLEGASVMPKLLPYPSASSTARQPPATMPKLTPKMEKSAVAVKVKKSNNSPIPTDPDDLVHREYKCSYPGCSIKLNCFRDYDTHCVTTHLRYPCKLCHSSFTGRNNRTRHMRHHHGDGIKPHICPDCGKAFARSDSLREHRYIHTDSYHEQKCRNCGTRCEKKALLLAHLKKCFGKVRSPRVSASSPTMVATGNLINPTMVPH